MSEKIKHESVEEFLARGGKINQVEQGVVAKDPKLTLCQCGCKGQTAKHAERTGQRPPYLPTDRNLKIRQGEKKWGMK